MRFKEFVSDVCPVCGQTPCNCTSIKEEKVRLDPACWHNKKIGNPKTKMKGGVRVNNCVPKEGVAEGSKYEIHQHDREGKPLAIYHHGSDHNDDVIRQNTRYRQKMNPRDTFKVFKDKKPFDWQGVAEDLSRRGFLKGLGAAAVAGAAGSAMAAPFKHSQNVDPMTDKVQGGNSTVSSDDGTAKLYIQWNKGIWFDLNQGRVGYSSVSSGFPLQSMRIKLGNSPVQDIVGTVSKNFKSIQVGSDPAYTKQLASKILKHSGELRLEVLLADGNKKVFKFTIEPDATSKSVKEQGVAEDWQKANKQDKTDGMSPKAVKAYRRENPGSKLQTAVTTKPSKLKPGSKAAKRRKSFCARMSGVEGPMKDEKGRPTAKAKALKRWNC